MYLYIYILAYINEIASYEYIEKPYFSPSDKCVFHHFFFEKRLLSDSDGTLVMI